MVQKRLGWIVIFLAGWWLRVPGLFANRFFADEALFATWARYIAVWREPFLQGLPVDKPPLLFYTQALFYPLFGPVTWAARMPNLLASLVLIAVTAVFVRRCFLQQETAVLAATLVALSPMAIQFSPTAFIDPLLTALVMGSLAWHKRPPLSGLLFGLALLTKYQALLFLPLLAAFAWLDSWHFRAIRQWMAGFLPTAALYLLWDIGRTGTLSLFQQQVSNYGGIRLAWSWELWPRLVAWARLWWLAWGGWPLLLVGGALVLLPFWAKPTAPKAAVDWVLGGFVTGYTAVHWLLAIPAWDRYLLPGAPLTAVLLARFIMAAFPKRFNRYSLIINCGLVVLFLLPGAWQARNGRLPIGGSPTADSGAQEIAQLLYDAPYGTVLYDHWYSWQWRYHLFDRRVYVSWLPYPAALADELAAFGQDGAPRYVALPADERARPFMMAVSQVGSQLVDISPPSATGIRLYQIVPH
ncbi:MAG: glycosyltransferase family 39 protein [Candidatus Promineifilaceae bacterium]